MKREIFSFMKPLRKWVRESINYFQTKKVRDEFEHIRQVLHKAANTKGPALSVEVIKGT